MAFVPFYLDPAATGAADLNSGSTVAAPTHTYGGGTFVRATGVYTVASGTPNSDGFVAAGDYVSVYTTSGRTVATFVSKVLSTDATTITVDVATYFYGVATTVSEGANASSLTIGGSWATPLVLGATLTAGGLGTFTVPQSTKINMKGNQTIAAAPTISMAGATSTPLWFSGYNTNLGDVDGDTTNTLLGPTWTINTNLSVTTSGAYQQWSGLILTGSNNAALWQNASSSPKMTRCRATNANAGTGAGAFSVGASGLIAYCYFKCATTATAAAVVNVTGAETVLIGVTAEGGGLAGFQVGSSRGLLTDCISLGNTGAGVLASTSILRLLRHTVAGSAGTVDGVKWTGTPGLVASVVGCLFCGVNGGTALTNGINASAGTTGNVFRACNDYFNVTNPEVGMGDSPAFFGQTDSAYPLTSATNLTPIAGSNARNHGFPGVFENEPFSAFLDIGAVDAVDPFVPVLME